MKFVCWCPDGQTCGKQNKRLGAFNSEIEAVGKIVSHLQNSPSHGMGESEAQSLVDSRMDCIAQEEEWKDDTEQQPKRSQPYPVQQRIGWQREREVVDAARLQAAVTTAVSSQVAPITAMQLRLEQQALRCEQAARAAAKLARQAAAAFEEEAATIRDLIDELRRSV